MQPKPSSVEVLSPDGTKTTYNVSISGVSCAYKPGFPTPAVELTWSYQITRRKTITKNGKLISDNSDSKPETFTDTYLAIMH